MVLLSSLIFLAISQQSVSAQRPIPAGSAHLKIPDVELIDQNGKKVRFKSDILQNRIAAINFLFTTCTTVCLPIGANFGKLESVLRTRSTRDFILVSISVDPVTDTPERLRAWSRQFGAGPGWTLLTGTKRNVDELLLALGAFTTDKLQHSTTMLVGGVQSGAWNRVNALAPPARVADMMFAIAGQGL